MQPQNEQNFWQPTAEPVEAADPVAPDVTGAPVISEQPPEAISWQASEFIHHEKDGTWFLAVIGIAATLLVIAIFAVKSWTFSALVVVMAIAAIVVGRRPPRTIDYSLTLQGIQIDEKLFSFHDFHSFGIIQEGALYSVRLVPNKRFMPMVSLYFPSEQGEQIIDLLGSVLPMEHVERDPIDKIVEKLRF